MECLSCHQTRRSFKCSSCCNLFVNLKKAQQDEMAKEITEMQSKLPPLSKTPNVSYSRLLGVYLKKRDSLTIKATCLANIPKKEPHANLISEVKPSNESHLIQSRRRLVKELIALFRLRKSKSSLEYRIHNSSLSLSAVFPRDRFNASLAFTAQLTNLLALYTDTVLPFEINTLLPRPTITATTVYYLYLGQELSESFYIAVTALCFNVAYIAHCNGVVVEDESKCCSILDLIAKTCTSNYLATGNFGAFEIDFDVLYAAVYAALNGETDLAGVVDRVKSGEDQWEKL